MELRDEKGNVICQLCGKSFRYITASHLKKAHQITMEKYKQDFPNALLISDITRATRKYNSATLFKEDRIIDETPKPEIKIEEFQIDKIPIIKNKIKYEIEFMDDVKTFAQESLEFPNPNNSIHRDKLKILSYLFSFYRDLQDSYFIEKYSLSKNLEYKLVTDMCSPTSKIDFEFPDTFWHNQDIPKISRDEKLRRDGWKIINVFGPKPSIEEIKKILKPI